MTISAEQREFRRNFIGSSDAAIACGVSPYATRVQLWMDKTGRQPMEPMNAERALIGDEGERTVGLLFNLRHADEGLTAQPVSDTIIDGHRCANLDFLIEPGNEPLEAKTAPGWRSADFTAQVIPVDYRIQVEHAMDVYRANRSRLGVLIGGTEYREIPVLPNEELRASTRSLVADFWHHVETDRPPAAVNREDVLLLFGHATEGPQERLRVASKEAMQTVEQILRLRSEERALRRDRAKLMERLAVIMGPAWYLIESTDEGEHENQVLATFRPPDGTETDWQSVCADLHRLVARAQYDQAVRRHSRPNRRRLWVQGDRDGE